MIKRRIKIHAPVEIVYQVVRDFKAYPEFLETTKSVKEKEKSGVLTADFSIDLIKEVHYTLQFELDPPKSLSWSLVKGEIMKKNSGAWELKALGEDETQAEYSIDIEFGWLVPKMIVEKLTETQLPAMLKSFKTRAESIFRAQKSVSG